MSTPLSTWQLVGNKCQAKMVCGILWCLHGGRQWRGIAYMAVLVGCWPTASVMASRFSGHVVSTHGCSSCLFWSILLQSMDERNRARCNAFSAFNVWWLPRHAASVQCQRRETTVAAVHVRTTCAWPCPNRLIESYFTYSFLPKNDNSTQFNFLVLKFENFTS